MTDRLKAKGVDIPGEAPGIGVGASSLTAAALAAAASADLAQHAPLAVSASEQKQLFTPLVDQGSKAVEAEKQRRDANETEVMASVRGILKRWVQESLANDEKRQKLRDNDAVLKCRVQARWSEGLNKKLKVLVAEYGGRLLADSDKDGAVKPPAWATAAELRTAKWLVGFDAAAFERFMTAHPETVEPPEDKVRSFVKEFIRNADLQTLKVYDLLEGLQLKFGKLRRPSLERAKGMALVEIMEVHETGVKRTAPGLGKGGGKKQKTQLREEVKARIEKDEDVRWAEAALVPLGFKKDSDEPVVRSPQSVALPILMGMKGFQDMRNFRELLKSTKIGKVVNAFRHHPSPEVAKIAKDLVASWKVALAAGKKKSKEAAEVAAA